MVRSLIRVIVVTCGVVLGRSGLFGQATSLTVGFNPAACVPPCVFVRAGAGQVVPVLVVARDGAGNADSGYRGTVTFSSTDPLATLPGPYTFTATDAGGHNFPSDTIFRTVGEQTLTATDIDHGLSAATSILVQPIQPTTSIPLMAGIGKVAAMCSLAVVGIWLAARTP
jgi:hypothetical protein